MRSAMREDSFSPTERPCRPGCRDVVPGLELVPLRLTCDARVDAVAGLERIGEDQVLGRTAQEDIRAFRFSVITKELGDAGSYEHVAHLGGGLAAVEPVHEDPPDGQQLASA